jgi:hypothetical protein
MRTVFEKPIPKSELVDLFEKGVQTSRNGVSERALALVLDIDRRQVRKIAERLNKRGYIDHDNSVKYHVFPIQVKMPSGKKKTIHRYFVVRKRDPRCQELIDKRKWDAIAALKAYKIYLDDLGIQEQGNQTFLDLDIVIDSLESDD